jgi:hypothetical protein
MCVTPDEPEVVNTPPPEVLKQATPDKKTAAQPSKAGSLAIGTKKYRNVSGLGNPGLGTKPPTGISV